MKIHSIIKLHILILNLIFSSLYLSAQEVQAVSFKNLEERIKNEEETLVMNFWATFCKPCIKELPLFDEVNAEKNVKVLLVSSDFVNQIEKVKKFIINNNIESETVLINETDPNFWIPKVSKDWSGALPATLVTHRNKMVFHEGIITRSQLKEMIKTVKK